MSNVYNEKHIGRKHKLFSKENFWFLKIFGIVREIFWILHMGASRKGLVPNIFEEIMSQNVVPASAKSFHFRVVFMKVSGTFSGVSN